jgi:hypothetical protein
MRIIAAALFSLVLVTGAALAQENPPILYQPDPDTPIGTMNPNALPETAQYAFLIGDWDVVINFRDAAGNEATYNAKWHNVWAIDGYAVMQEWRGPFATGVEMRRFNPNLGHWEGFNMYNAWDATRAVTANWNDEEMVVMIDETSDETGTFINRETYSTIEENRWEMRSDRSYDDGETWVRGAYDMVATRAE